MKNKLRFLGIIALVAVIGFSLVACKDEEEELDPISITVTGIPGTEKDGWKANLGIEGSAGTAVDLPKKVTSSTTSLTFNLMDGNLEPWTKAGTYSVMFWFEKEGEDDVDYIKFNHSIVNGSNTIELSSFTELE